MADLLDQADVNIEYALKQSLADSVKPVPKGEPNGYCWFCEEAVEHPKRWCNAECRDMWERENG